ncbi:MAG: acyl-CoA thioesterase [Candidatus Cyclobacteriaceae bacterium M3_2C_046]
MAKVDIPIPENFLFETHIKIRVTDLNYGAHLGNDRVLGLMHEARIQFLQSLGVSNEKDGIDGLGIIMNDAAIAYKSEAFYGDELLIQVGVYDVRRVSFDVVYRLIRVADQKEVAAGKTGVVCFNYANRKVSPFPSEFFNKLKK